MMIKSIFKEYGLAWVLNRSLYSAKLKIMKHMPLAENLFEKNVRIKRIDIIDINVSKIEDFLIKLNETEKQKIINIANRAIEGKIKAFSSIELDYQSPINWHLNPLTNIRIEKNKKWFQISDFDPIRGDIKVVWEASRFTHFFYFARAYMITKNKKYYEAFSNQLSNWLMENKYSFGANYKCGQEATLRMINTLIIYTIFKSYKLTNKTDEDNVKQIIQDSYKKILSNFFYAYKCIRNNHTLSEITGLIIGAWCSMDETRLIKAYKLLDKEIFNQFLSDGGYIQYSFNYQRFALQIIEFIFKINKKTQKFLSNHSIELIRKSVLLMYALQDDSGYLPNYGSNDGALIFPVTSCDFQDFRPILNTIFTLIEGKRLYKPGIYDEEILWFSDIDIENAPLKKKCRESKAFYNSGFYSIRHRNGFLMIVLQEFKTRPAQMDQLHIDLWHKGINILCDSGTYSYATSVGQKMALTSSHNTIQVDKKEQMKKYGPFLIYSWPLAKNIEFGNDYFRGTMISKNGYSHTRKVTKFNDGYLVEDCIDGIEKEAKIILHTPCEVNETEKGLELYNKGNIVAVIDCNKKIKLSKDYRSLYYLKTEEVNVIMISTNVIDNQTKSNLYIKLL